MPFKLPERLRWNPPGVLIDSAEGGYFSVAGPRHGTALSRRLNIIASNGAGREHVSVSIHKHPHKTPTWAEMCFVKDLFWDEEDAVMQLHPPRSRWISNHDGCLHLWRPIGKEIPLPPDALVGVKGLTHDQIRGEL